ncbi:hypothetical protein CNYM01_07912 [Colletotrichum nymphaeae SA-01]|uniref:Uncharacterized protein n=1 Tax=Colletotrichum nymphaeae SA-01 TaxID=1460502 RepID=A0A135TQ72_9PEZI|nr:hypothetical protein CNYM01_07912 [Colletotrichum nymphaeae SA-01]
MARTSYHLANHSTSPPEGCLNLGTIGHPLLLLQGPRNSLFRFPLSTLLKALQFATTPVLAFLTLLPQTLCLIPASTSRCALPASAGGPCIGDGAATGNYLVVENEFDTAGQRRSLLWCLFASVSHQRQ